MALCKGEDILQLSHTTNVYCVFSDCYECFTLYNRDVISLSVSQFYQLQIA